MNKKKNARGNEFHYFNNNSIGNVKIKKLKYLNICSDLFEKCFWLTDVYKIFYKTEL